ncbi:hypothetical protein QBC40DRAFT_282436 [Triangularia verruculosa]|uniref:Uncharacterized protein n=1 Tax=Triangularia verruculosa TaxID=2587418 RepID=A0AAN6XEM0_9PEZI|nr:hypothetical protein QBC40DRAFT_282436 [Triangularia verruculosa]
MASSSDKKPGKLWSKIRQVLRSTQAFNSAVDHETPEEEYIAQDSDYPTFPPPPPRQTLQSTSAYRDQIKQRKFACPRGVFQDSPLYALYRLYEFFLLDDVLAYRNALEAFWRQSDPAWSLSRIPDPKTADPGFWSPDLTEAERHERYAFLAGCTYLLVRSFNARVKLGLSRQMKSLITPEEAEAARNVPLEERSWEKVPEWAENAPALPEFLVVPTHEGEVLSGPEDQRADEDFLRKGILLWTPHVYFT